MLRLILGMSGTGKTQYIQNSAAECVRAGQSCVLLVPEQNSFDCERAMLSLLGAADCGRVEVLSFSRLSQPIGLITGGFAGNRADDGVRLIYMSNALKKCAPGLLAYKRAAAHSDFAQNVLMSVNELKMSGIDSSDLMSAAERAGGVLGARLHDLAIVMGEYDAMLSERFIDPIDDMTRLYDMVVSSKFFVGKKVYVDSFKSFTGQQMKIMGEIIGQADEVCVALCADSLASRGAGDIFDNVKQTAASLTAAARRCGCAVAAPTVLDTYRRFGGTLADAADALSGCEGVRSDGDGQVCICSAKTAADEADFVARTVRRLVRTEGYRYRDFAVVYRNGGTYARTLRDSMDEYGIPCFCDARTASSELMLMKYTLLSLRAALRYSTDSLLALAKLPLSPLDFEQACELDNYALMWSVNNTAWCADFADNPAGFGKPMDEGTLERINGYRAKLIGPIIGLHAALESQNVENVCTEIYNYLSGGAGERLIGYAAELDEMGEHAAADVQRASWRCLMGVLDSCVSAYGERPCEPNEFVNMIATVIAAQDIGAIPSRLDEVIIGSADRIRLGDVKVTFMVGVNYGEFPRLPESRGLFSARDRKRLIELGFDIDDGSVQVSVDERFVTYGAATSPSERLYICYRTSGAKGETLAPSDTVDRLKKVEGVRFIAEEDTRCDCMECESGAVDWLVGRYDLESVRAAAQAAGSVKMADDCNKISRAADFESNTLSADTATRLFGRDIYMSPSRAEVYSKCAFSYFCKYGIGAKKLAPADINAIERGTVIHYILEQSVRRYGADLHSVDAGQLHEFITATVDDYVDNYFGGRTRRSPRFINSIKVITDTAEFLVNYIAEQFRCGCFEPDGCEVRVGDDIPPISVPLDEGTMTVTGSIDRVDIYRADGKTYLRVVDYKTGAKRFDLTDVLYGINMQMLMYLTALCMADESAEPAGVLYMPSKKPSVSGERADGGEAVSDAYNGLKMNGVLTDDIDLLVKMAGGTGFYPFSLKKDGTLSAKSAVVSPEQFRIIGDYISKKLQDIGNSLHAGAVGIDPLDGTESKACKYCDYSDVCLRDRERENRCVQKQAYNDVIEQMKGECNGGD